MFDFFCIVVLCLVASSFVTEILLAASEFGMTNGDFVFVAFEFEINAWRTHDHEYSPFKWVLPGFFNSTGT